MAENTGSPRTTTFARALATIDRQVPSLKYLGLAFWMAWNTIAFSGSFWLRDTANSLRAEDLILCHLVACVATLSAFALTSNRSAKLVTKNWLTLLGGCVAVLGTLLIVIAREDLLKSITVFYLGSVLTGSGTTVLFMRAAPMFGALPPRRSISLLACCALLGAAVYFMLFSCGGEIATVGFILLPLLSVLFFALHQGPSRVEERVLRPKARPSRKLVVFFASICLCSFAFELAKGIVLVGLPPACSIESMVFSQVIGGALMTALIVATLLMSERYNYGKYYSAAVFALAVLLIVVAVLGLYTTPTASLANAACNCFNLVVWSMFAYVVFQAEADAVSVFGFGNASLSAGTALASVVAMAAHGHPELISEDLLRALMLALGLIVLVNLVLVFSERQINDLLVPLDQPRKAQDTLGVPERQPKQWVLTCEAIAEAQGLSEREREVFVALARGKTAQEIADRDVLSVYTVRAHIRSIYAKLDVHSRKELMKFIEDRLE